MNFQGSSLNPSLNIYVFSNFNSCLIFQATLVKLFYPSMATIENCFVTFKQDGHLTNQIYYPNYRYSDIDEAEEAIATHMKKALNDIVLPLSMFQATDIEVVGLFLLMLFNPCKCWGCGGGLDKSAHF